WLMVLQVEGMDEQRRAVFMSKLKENQVDSRPFFYPMSDMPHLSAFKADTPLTHKVYVEGINLPTYYDLKEDDVQYVCSTIKRVLQEIMVLC
ncbi:MAG TPA: DegT/DnrJ/EryC1/StrS family aminotransferase, partial [Acidobacteriota bacterium]